MLGQVFGRKVKGGSFWKELLDKDGATDPITWVDFQNQVNLQRPYTLDKVRAEDVHRETRGSPRRSRNR